MRQIRKWKGFVLAIAVALPGGNLASAVLPVHALPESVTQISAAGHQHGESPHAGAAGCAAACQATVSCTLTGLPVIARSALGPEAPRTDAVPAESLHIPEDHTALPESPPPRA